MCEIMIRAEVDEEWLILECFEEGKCIWRAGNSWSYLMGWSNSFFADFYREICQVAMMPLSTEEFIKQVLSALWLNPDNYGEGDEVLWDKALADSPITREYHRVDTMHEALAKVAEKYNEIEKEMDRQIADDSRNGATLVDTEFFPDYDLKPMCDRPEEDKKRQARVAIKESVRRWPMCETKLKERIEKIEVEVKDNFLEISFNDLPFIAFEMDVSVDKLHARIGFLIKNLPEDFENSNADISKRMI